MAQPATFPDPIDVDTYLRDELTSELRHEYIGGQVYAMGGASSAHNLIALNLATALHVHLRGGPCQVFMSDMKVRFNVSGERIFYYPDLLVSCREQDRARYWREHPCLIVEVASPSTARIDRREKLFAYREIEALEEYLLVDQDSCRLTLLRRANGWKPLSLSETDTFDLTSVGLKLPVTALYEGVEWGADEKPHDDV